MDKIALQEALKNLNYLMENFTYGEKDGLFIIYLDGEVYMTYPSLKKAEADGWVLNPQESIFFDFKNGNFIAKSSAKSDNLKFYFDSKAKPNPEYMCYYFNCIIISTGRIDFLGRLSIYIKTNVRYPYKENDNDKTVISYSYNNDKIPFYRVSVNDYLKNPKKQDLIAISKFYDKLRGKNESYKRNKKLRESTNEPFIYNGKNKRDVPKDVVEIIIEDGVEYLQDFCFDGCRLLQSVTIPNSVKTFGMYCFSGCKSLYSITIPDSVIKFDAGCFFRCESLQSIAIPNSVTKISHSCFYGCTSLKSITIPDSVTRMSEQCFNDCTSLQSITIPDSVENIDWHCFDGCRSLRTVKTMKNARAAEYFHYNYPKVKIEYIDNGTTRKRGLSFNELKKMYYNETGKNADDNHSDFIDWVRPFL